MLMVLITPCPTVSYLRNVLKQYTSAHQINQLSQGIPFVVLPADMQISTVLLRLNELYQEKTIPISLVASSSRSVQCTALSTLVLPKRALKVSGLTACARTGSAGPHSSRSASTGEYEGSGLPLLLTSSATDAPAQLGRSDWSGNGLAVMTRRQTDGT